MSRRMKPDGGISISEHEPLRQGRETIRDYFVNVMEMKGEDWDGETLNLQWRASATDRRGWESPERTGSSLVCNLKEWV